MLGEEERSRARHDFAIRFERARIGVDRLATGVLRDFHRRFAEERKAVERWVVHPNPNRKARGRKQCGIARREILRLFFRDFERKANVEPIQDAPAPGTRANHEFARTKILAAGYCTVIVAPSSRTDSTGALSYKVAP